MLKKLIVGKHVVITNAQSGILRAVNAPRLIGERHLISQKVLVRLRNAMHLMVIMLSQIGIFIHVLALKFIIQLIIQVKLVVKLMCVIVILIMLETIGMAAVVTL